jgi:hypothetical protein
LATGSGSSLEDMEKARGSRGSLLCLVPAMSSSG